VTGAADDDTLQFYRRNTEAYAGRAKAPSKRLKGCLALLPQGGSILELGCGAGNHAAEILAAGFRLRATDGSPEMAAIAARRLGHPVATMRFDELEEREAHDGVWASACLLHVPRDELAGVLSRIRRALKRDGVFYASYKIGHGDGGRDSLAATTIIPRPNGCSPPMPRRERGIRSRPTPARSRALTRRRRRCCTSSCGNAHDPEKCEAVFPRDKRRRRLRGGHAPKVARTP
jgi:SAM-dependent methyltransferase